MADGRAGGAGDRRSELRPRDDRLERGRRRGPRSSRSAPPPRARSIGGSPFRRTPPIAMGAGRPSDRRRGAPARWAPGDDRLLLDLQRPDVSRTRRSSGAPRSRTCDPCRARRRRVADVALAGPVSRSATSRASCRQRSSGRADGRSPPPVARGTSLTVRGEGERRSIDAGDLRDAVNTWAPCLRPAPLSPGDGEGHAAPHGPVGLAAPVVHGARGGGDRAGLGTRRRHGAVGGVRQSTERLSRRPTSSPTTTRASGRSSLRSRA